MSSGLHGENGLDLETAIHLKQTYILPVLIYGIEVVLPKRKSLICSINSTRNSSR